MNRVRCTTTRPSRVYTRRAALIALLLLVTAGLAGAEPVVELTAEPEMNKGPREAPVTIVEFSDYQ